MALLHALTVQLHVLQVQSTYATPPEVIITAFPFNAAQIVLLGQASQAELYISYMSNLGAVIEQQQLPGVHMLMLNGTGLPTSDWCADHPNAAAHAFFAEQVLDLIDGILPGYATSSFTSAAAPMASLVPFP